MDNRIDQTFLDLRKQRRAGFMAYITGGDPSLARTVDIALALADAGVDFLEIGVPFSDPLADGVANQLGAQRALAAGTTLSKLLKTISAIRSKSSTPIILYSYLNPIFQYGFSRFERDAADSGVDGLLLLDLPPDETLIEDKPRTMHRIRLVAPTTAEGRIKQIVSQASGFVYYVSREGVTGERHDLAQSIAGQIAKIRQHTRLPVAVGFGISTPDQVRQVASWADAVVVGSAIVRRIGELAREESLPKRIGDFIRPLVEAVRNARTPEAFNEHSR
ncbi:MAG: tryptophan synthase subunit alpha [Chthoniobacterales bacterium]